MTPLITTITREYNEYRRWFSEHGGTAMDFREWYEQRDHEPEEPALTEGEIVALGARTRRTPNWPGRYAFYGKAQTCKCCGTSYLGPRWQPGICYPCWNLEMEKKAAAS